MRENNEQSNKSTQRVRNSTKAKHSITVEKEEKNEKHTKLQVLQPFLIQTLTNIWVLKDLMG